MSPIISSPPDDCYPEDVENPEEALLRAEEDEAREVDSYVEMVALGQIPAPWECAKTYYQNLRLVY